MNKIEEDARNLAILICPLAFQLDDGDAIERMPNDLFRAANTLGELCRILAQADAVIAHECFDRRAAREEINRWADEALERHDLREREEEAEEWDNICKQARGEP
jgi:hypothetical protein